MSVEVVTVDYGQVIQDLTAQQATQPHWRTAMFRQWYDSPYTWRMTYWRGRSVLKCPLDLWVYQDLIFALRPDLIVETGTGNGGSSYFFGDLLDVIYGQGDGGSPQRVITCDVTLPTTPGWPHPRVTPIQGSSITRAVLARIEAAASSATRVLVSLDSDHTTAHVLQELRRYSTLPHLTYLVVEDTHVPGPATALAQFHVERPGTWEPDPVCERYQITCNPGGWLRKAGSISAIVEATRRNLPPPPPSQDPGRPIPEGGRRPRTRR